MTRPLQIPFGFARTRGVLLRHIGEDHARVAVRAGTHKAAIGELRRFLGVPLQLETVSQHRFDEELAAAYSGGENTAAEIAADVGQEVDLEQLMTDLPAVEDLLDAQDEAPIIRLINALLSQAVREGASDIHIEPYESASTVRFRRDGMLRDVAHPHRGLHAALASRIKVMANLDIAEKRLPQDGRIGIRLAGRKIDVRVSTLPTAHGERVVLRLLDQGGARLGLAALGMAEEARTRFATLLEQQHGILLVTGPTGSGKTTTLYAALQTMDARQRNIVTVEDPVEYDLPGVGQTQVNPRIQLSFARALRSILRQDPDVIMIGEIRDLETAQIAIQASLTGHLVLATLHTNDAPSAVTRLVDMGIEPYLLASTLRGVLAQRLVRRLCPQCATDGAAATGGCAACGHTGYDGRTGIYELLVVDAPLAQLIHERADEARLRAECRARGTRSLFDDGMRLVAAGITSREEVLRVTRD